jgi:hypothetical protein
MKMTKVKETTTSTGNDTAHDPVRPFLHHIRLSILTTTIPPPFSFPFAARIN